MTPGSSAPFKGIPPPPPPPRGRRARLPASQRICSRAVQGRDIAGGKNSVRIIEHPDVRRMLMLMRCQIEAMRALAYFVAGAHDQADQHPDPEERARNAALVGLLTPVIKGWCTETAIEIASIGIQIHGGVGYVEGTGAAQYLRDVRITAIYEGTTGIQANDLMGRKIAHDQGAAVGKLMQEMQALACRLVETAHEDLPVIGGALQAGIAALGRAVDHVLANFSNQPRCTAVGAVPLLKLFGVVAGGWLMGRAAEAAAQQLATGSTGRSRLEMKLNTARFFADHVLVLAPGMAHSVCDGAGRIMEIDASQW
ncbi:MAG: acyl-CoA dehydrogenase [Steroidobacteraceae bacterium]